MKHVDFQSAVKNFSTDRMNILCEPKRLQINKAFQIYKYHLHVTHGWKTFGSKPFWVEKIAEVRFWISKYFLTAKLWSNVYWMILMTNISNTIVLLWHREDRRNLFVYYVKEYKDYVNQYYWTVKYHGYFQILIIVGIIIIIM